MAAGYCMYHKRYMNFKEIKIKRCRCKANTKKRCRYFIPTMKMRYRNNSQVRK